MFLSHALTHPVLLFPRVLHPQINIHTQRYSPFPVAAFILYPLSLPLLFWHSLHASMADLQRATSYTRGARCRGDLDGQGSDPRQREAAGDAAGFLQVPAAEHQAPCRRCAPLLVRYSFPLNVFALPLLHTTYNINTHVKNNKKQ